MGILLRDLLRLSGGLWRVAPCRLRSSPAASSLPRRQLYSTNSGSLEQFKAWLRQVLNSEKCTNGYNICSIPQDFEKAIGKPLDAKSLGFSKLIKLVQECKDVATLEETKHGCHLAFPVKQKKQNSLVSSPGVANPNPNPIFTPNSEASVDDFGAFIYQMLLAGEFSKGFPMCQLPLKFEQRTGKVLDVKHLGYKTLTQLVDQYSLLVSVDNAGTESRILPARFIREIVAHNSNPNTGTKVTVVIMEHDSATLKPTELLIQASIKV